MIEYQREKLKTFIRDVHSLAQEHFKETWAFEKKSRGVNWGLFQKLEESDALYIVTAREYEKLIGYFSVVVAPSLHSKGVVQAESTSIYTDSIYRKEGVGGKLIRTMIDIITPRVNILCLSMKADKPFTALVESSGFVLTDLVYTKEL